jgi:hypothetical protein
MPCGRTAFYLDVNAYFFKLNQALSPGNCAASRAHSSMSSSWLYIPTRSVRARGRGRS